MTSLRRAGGHRVDAAGDAAVERPQPGQVGARRCARSRRRRAGSAAARRALDLATAASALRGSCHQCGSYFDASSPSTRRAGGPAPPAPRSTTSASLPLSETTSSIQASRSSPLAKTSAGARGGLDVAGPRLVLVRVGVRLQDLVDRDRFAADRADPVAELGRRRDHVELAVVGRAAPAAAGREQGEGERRGGERRRRRGRAAEGPRRGDEREDGAGDAGDRRPRRGVGLDREPEPGRALERDQGDAGSCQLAQPPVEEPGGRSRGRRRGRRRGGRRRRRARR